MAVVSRNILKQWFSRGKKPTEEQFSDLIDSYYHKGEDAISSGGGEGVAEHNDLSGREKPDSHPIEAITGLQSRLNEIATAIEWQ